MISSSTYPANAVSSVFSYCRGGYVNVCSVAKRQPCKSKHIRQEPHCMHLFSVTFGNLPFQIRLVNQNFDEDLVHCLVAPRLPLCQYAALDARDYSPIKGNLKGCTSINKEYYFIQNFNFPKIFLNRQCPTATDYFKKITHARTYMHAHRHAHLHIYTITCQLLYTCTLTRTHQFCMLQTTKSLSYIFF